jgi:predicted lipoprotein with Yx(FWY)xxD motif
MQDDEEAHVSLSLRRRLPALIAAPLLIALVAACSSSGGVASSAPGAASSPPAAASSAPATSESPASSAAGLTITVREDPELGEYLAGENEMTLYIFTPDTEPDASTCTGQCAENWPPLTVEDGEQVVGGEGADGEFTTFARDDGSMQVAYGGKPLYYFKNDKAAGDVTGQGLNDVWFVAEP